MKKYFLTGLVILLPVAITIAVIHYLINFFTTPFVHLVSTFLRTTYFTASEFVIVALSKCLILICLFFFILGLGMLTRWFVVQAIVNIGDRILQKIPFINAVYKTTKEIIKSVFSSDTGAFKRVVLVPFPRKDIWALGLIAGDSPSACSRSLGSSLITVLIPTTPSPISGFLLMYRPEELIYLDMKPEQAIKYIISCGTLTPHHQKIV